MTRKYSPCWIRLNSDKRLSFAVENKKKHHILTAFWKESMIKRLSNLIDHNRSEAKISQALGSLDFCDLIVTEYVDVFPYALSRIGHIWRRGRASQ